jgi:ferredoxin
MDAMRQSSRYRIGAFLVAAAGVALVVIAVFGGSTSASKRTDEGGQMPAGRTGGLAARPPTVMKGYACPQCGSQVVWGSNTCPRCGWCPRRLPAGAKTLSKALPSPREQNAAGKDFIEGHWLGLEVIRLTPELAKEYGVPEGETGVLVDEITLEAAESGILAGDMVQSVGGSPTPDLKGFFLATQRVREERQARVGVSRRGSKMTFIIGARNTKEMGFAQMEAAQPIRPGSISPHRSRGRACTDCHIIMRSGGQLPTDAGDILPSPPPIAAGAKPTHGNRGRCATCHTVVKGGVQPPKNAAGGPRTKPPVMTNVRGALRKPPPIAKGAKPSHGDRGLCSTCHVIRW